MIRAVFVLLALIAMSLPSPAVGQTPDDLGPPSTTDPVTVERDLEAPLPTLRDVAVGRHAEYDRVVFQWDGPAPGYTVEYVDEVTRQGSGELVELEGDAALEVWFTPATAHDASGLTFNDESQVPRFPALRQAEFTGDFEAVVSFGLGVSRQLGFRVLELTDPTRVVVDVAHPAVPEVIPVDEACVGVTDQGFTDVPESNTFADLIDCLAAYGITRGTDAGDTYEPRTSVRRRQMALFLQRYLELVAPDQVPTNVEPAGFTDIGDLSAEAQQAINVLASLEVTMGATPEEFRPHAFVRRDQMASFINRALGVVGAQPTTDRDFFGDDGSSTHEANINGLASVGIVQGVGGNEYAPGDPVSRGQMAAFLVRPIEYSIEQGDFPAGGPGTDIALDASCLLAPTDDALPSVALQHPEGWEQTDGAETACRYFDPEPVDIPADTETFGVDVRWDIESVAFPTAAEPGPEAQEIQRVPTTIDGHEAVRITAVSTGETLLPEGVETTSWLVNLAADADATGGTLVGTVADTDEIDYVQAVGVLDRMARSADIAPDAG